MKTKREEIYLEKKKIADTKRKSLEYMKKNDIDSRNDVLNKKRKKLNPVQFSTNSRPEWAVLENEANDDVKLSPVASERRLDCRKKGKKKKKKNSKRSHDMSRLQDDQSYDRTRTHRTTNPRNPLLTCYGTPTTAKQDHFRSNPTLGRNYSSGRDFDY